MFGNTNVLETRQPLGHVSPAALLFLAFGTQARPHPPMPSSGSQRANSATWQETLLHWVWAPVLEQILHACKHAAFLPEKLFTLCAENLIFFLFVICSSAV